MRTFALAIAVAALLFPAISTAQQIHPLNMVSGVDSLPMGTETKAFYTVPLGKTFVLTGLTTARNGHATEGGLYDGTGFRYVLQRTGCQSYDATCAYTLSLPTGVVFQSGQDVVLKLFSNITPHLRFSWSGYLVSEVVGVEPSVIPDQRLGFSLGPNPSGQVVELRFELERPADVSLRIYDVAGRLVTTLADARLPAGRHDLTWTGKTGSGEPVAAGVYFARLESSEVNSVRRLVRVR
jgi:FlgD Ig-like domain